MALADFLQDLPSLQVNDTCNSQFDDMEDFADPLKPLPEHFNSQSPYCSYPNIIVIIKTSLNRGYHRFS